MPGLHTIGRGWRRDLPDPRDFTPATTETRELLRRAKRRRTARSAKPTQIDLREYCSPPRDNVATGSTSPAAVLGMLDYFARRATGRAIDGSAAFLAYTARRLDRLAAGESIGLRTTLRALAQFGVPPRRYWPGDADRGDSEPDAFAYGFQRETAGLHYIRLDPPNRSGSETLAAMQSFLTAGYACVCGATLFGEPQGADLPFPTNFDAPAGGTAFTVVGFDDAVRIRSTKGALIVRGTDGPDFGDGGYARLPYRYVEEQLACDVWTIVSAAWIASGEFEQVVLGS